jgi:hypothetical protein
MRLEAGLEREAQLSLDAIHCHYRRAGKRAGMEGITQRRFAGRNVAQKHCGRPKK